MADPDQSADSELYERVVALVLDETRTRKRLSSMTELVRDLGVDGLDAYELLVRFKNEFDVDMSGFNFNLYFGPEGFCLIGFIHVLVAGNGLIPLTIGMLCEAAKAHRWIFVDQTPAVEE